LLGADRIEIVMHRVGDRVGAAMDQSLIDQMLLLVPGARRYLGLPEIERLRSVGVGEIISATECDRVVGDAAAVASRNPASGGVSAVVSKPQTFADFHEVGRAPHQQLCPRGAGLEREFARGTNHVRFSKFSPKHGARSERTLPNAGELSN